MEFLVGSVWAAGLAIGIAAFGCGIGQGLGLNGAMSGISRNPEAAGKIQVNMLIGLALIESLCIYALVVSLILMYAHPALQAATAAIGGHCSESQNQHEIVHKKVQGRNPAPFCFFGLKEGRNASTNH